MCVLFFMINKSVWIYVLCLNIWRVHFLGLPVHSNILTNRFLASNCSTSWVFMWFERSLFCYKKNTLMVCSATPPLPKILLRLKKTAIHHRVVGTIGVEQHSKAGIRLRYFKQIGDHHLPSSSHQKATTYWEQQDTFGAESREGFYWMHWNHESSKWRLLKVRTLPWTSNPTLRKVDVCPASNVSLQKQFREACGLGEECSVRPVRKQQWQRLWRFIPPPISSLQITAQKFYLS